MLLINIHLIAGLRILRNPSHNPKVVGYAGAAKKLHIQSRGVVLKRRRHIPDPGNSRQRQVLFWIRLMLPSGLKPIFPERSTVYVY